MILRMQNMSCVALKGCSVMVMYDPYMHACVHIRAIHIRTRAYIYVCTHVCTYARGIL